MTQPSDKSPAIENFLEGIAGRTTAITNDVCIPAPIGCGGPATDFRDELSRRAVNTLSAACAKTAKTACLELAMMLEVYIAMSMTDLNEIKDLEVLDQVPTFPNRIEGDEDAPFGLRIRVFVANINGGDSTELHWNDQVGEWQ